MNRAMEGMGGKVVQRYRIYERALWRKRKFRLTDRPFLTSRAHATVEPGELLETEAIGVPPRRTPRPGPSSRSARSAPTGSAGSPVLRTRFGPRRSPPPADARRGGDGRRRPGGAPRRPAARPAKRAGAASARSRSSPAARSWSTSTCSDAERRRRPARPLEVEVRPPWPYRLRRLGGDGVARAGGVARGCSSRGGRSWSTPGSRAASGSCSAPAAAAASTRRRRQPSDSSGDRADALRARRRRGPDRVRPHFRGDPLIGEVHPPPPCTAPKRRPWPWEALAWAVTEQLIESGRAAEIQRRVVGRWGPRG